MTDGTIENTDDKHIVFHYRRDLKHPIDKVWVAITDPAAIAIWMGTAPEIDLRPGGHYITHHGENGQRVVDRVLRVQAPELFEHSFFEQVNPDAVVSWRLQSTETGTLLELIHTMSYDDLNTAMTTVRPGATLLSILARNGSGWHRLLDLIHAHLDDVRPNLNGDHQPDLDKRYKALAEPVSEQLHSKL